MTVDKVCMKTVSHLQAHNQMHPNARNHLEYKEDQIFSFL